MCVHCRMRPAVRPADAAADADLSLCGVCHAELHDRCALCGHQERAYPCPACTDGVPAGPATSAG